MPFQVPRERMGALLVSGAGLLNALQALLLMAGVFDHWSYASLAFTAVLLLALTGGIHATAPQKHPLATALCAIGTALVGISIPWGDIVPGRFLAIDLDGWMLYLAGHMVFLAGLAAGWWGTKLRVRLALVLIGVALVLGKMSELAAYDGGQAGWLELAAPLLTLAAGLLLVVSTWRPKGSGPVAG